MIVAAVALALATPAPQILVNHLGYEPDGPKKAVIQAAEGDDIRGCVVEDAAKRHVLDVPPRRVGSVDHWRGWVYWTLDLTALRPEGIYEIACSTSAGPARSFPFRVQRDILERHTLSDVIYYFKGQRSSGPLDQADRSLPFEGRASGRVDVHGGWYDATGDYGKHLSHLSFSTYFNPQQIPLTAWALLEAHELLARRGTPAFAQYLRRLMDEAAWGADYLVRVKVEGGSFYRSVSAPGPGKKPEDRRIARDPSGYSLKAAPDQERPGEAPLRSDDLSYESSLRSGGGLAIAALARAATMGAPGERRADYLRAAREAWAFLADHNRLLTNDGRENIADDYSALLAAVELFRATSDPRYKTAADRRGDALVARLAPPTLAVRYWRADDGDRPFFHASDAGLPVVSLLTYLAIADPGRQAGILAAVRASLESEMAVTAEVRNPFGYARQLVITASGERGTRFFFPHDTEAAPWWQGENARLASLAFAARLALPRFAGDAAFTQRLRAYSQDQLDWILGKNPFDASMLQGTGRNNPEYLFFDSYEYTNAPGGICNGITSGFQDPQGIDFALPHTVTGGDHDWRWEEQWLPHATWYLLAVAAGDGLAAEERP
jgi:Glycosyl hydrolase family 9/Cellulase N-terminal ig-like domain